MPSATNPEAIQAQLAAIRRSRRIAYSCLLGPILLIVAMVALNNVTNGGMHVFVSGATWTRVFWFTLFGILAAGGLLLLGSLQRRCPRCGEGFFVTKHYRRTHKTDRPGGVNVFARRCVNCKLPLA